MPEARWDDCPIWYTTDGPPDRPALLLSNSLGTTLSLWDEQVPSLAERYHVIRYDTRGHGRSGAPPGPYSLETLGRDAVAVLDTAGAERAAVCGISLGGLTALWLALHAPARVTRLVPANTGAQIGTEGLWNDRIAAVARAGLDPLVESILERWFTPAFRTEHPEVMTRFGEMIRACPPTGYNGCCAAIRDADLRDQLVTIGCPCLVIIGNQDIATPPALGRLIHDRVPGSRLVPLETGHLSNVELPEQFGAALEEFLDE